jgi:quinol monooxygenase YgiN
MSIETSVSINPYFRISDENMAAAREILSTFCGLVKNEEGCLYYNFCFNGNVMTCREAYADAAAIFAHLENCGEALGKFVQIAELFPTRRAKTPAPRDWSLAIPRMRDRWRFYGSSRLRASRLRRGTAGDCHSPAKRDRCLHSQALLRYAPLSTD